MDDILKIVKEEIETYRTGGKDIVEGYSFSPYKLIRRIMLYKNQIYPTGKFDSQGNYKYWFDIITPRCSSEIKNIDFDTKDISLYSEDIKNDFLKIQISDLKLKEWLKDTGQAEKLNEAVEIGTEFGNVVWKRLKNDYEVMQLNKFMVLNITAKSLEESDVIEEANMLSSDLRRKTDIWENVEDLIKTAPVNETPEFFIYERNGEVSEKVYNKIKNKKEGKEDKFVLTKIIVGGVKEGKPSHILFSDEMNEMPYKEYHRSSYSGRWFREGIYETLLDIQTRANEIGNQIARGLEYSSKVIFTGEDKLIVQNITTDLVNGDYIKAKDLHQVEVRLQGLDQLIVDWNRLMDLADKLANSYEVVTGESLGSAVPFRLGAMMNQNAGKLFDFIREKLGIAFQGVIADWILPEMLKNLKLQDVVKLTSDSGILNKYYKAVADDWYIKNLTYLPPHTEEQAMQIKDDKLQELMQKKEANVELSKDMWKDFIPKVRVNIVGENYNLMAELETLNSFIALEQDPIRRTALIEIAMRKKGLDVDSLPKTPPVQEQPQDEELNSLVDQQLQGFKNKNKK